MIYNLVILILFLVALYWSFIEQNPQKFSNKMVNKTAERLIKSYGNPHRIELDTKTKKATKIEWHNVDGCDGIIIKGDVKYKWHPIPAVTFVYAYKYMNVPEKLQGALMYASETIGVDYVDIPDKQSKNYYKTGQKMMAKVSGACASVTISVITIKFVEDMVAKYGNSQFDIQQLYQYFRAEYDQRILNFLCGKGIKPAIPWYPNKAESDMVNGPFEGKKLPNQCMNV